MLEKRGIDADELYQDLANGVLDVFVKVISFESVDGSWIRVKTLKQIECDFFKNVEAESKKKGAVFHSSVSFYINEKFLKEDLEEERDNLELREYEELSAETQKLSRGDILFVREEFDRWVFSRTPEALERLALSPASASKAERKPKFVERKLQAHALCLLVLIQALKKSIPDKLRHGDKLSKNALLRLLLESVDQMDAAFPEYAELKVPWDETRT